MKESDIQKQIFDYATTISREYNFLMFSIPNESLMTALMMFGIDKKKSYMLVNHFKKMGLVPGIPDMCLLWSGKSFFIEVKKPGEKPTDDQLRIHEIIEGCGGYVYTVCSLEEFQYILNVIGVFDL